MPKSGTPSGNSNLTDALDELLGIITGGAEKEEHLLTQISSKLNKSTLGKMISETAEPQMEFLSTSANMLVAIAGYLYGDKGVSIGTSAGSLTGRIKNSSPILGDKPVAQQLAEDGGGSDKKDKPSPEQLAVEGGGLGKSNKALEIEIAITGIDDKGLEAIRKVLETIKEAAGVDRFEDVDVIDDMATFLTTLTDKIGSVKFDKFDKNFLDQVLNFNVSLEAVLDISKNVSKKMPYLLLLTLFEDTIKNFPRVITEMVSGTNGRGGLIMIMNHINKAEAEGLDPKILTSFFEETTVLLKTLGKLGMAATIASSLGENIRPAVDKMLEIVKQLDGIKLPNIKGSVANLKKISDVITALKNVCIGLAICGLTALPALLGAIILPFVIKALDKTVEAVETLLDRLSKKKEFNVNLKQLCMTVLVIGVIMLVAALVGGLLLSNIKNILGFALVLSAFIMMIMLPFALIDFLFGKNGGKLIDSISKLSMIIVTCALVMMLGAVFMLTGLWKESLKFGATLMGFMFMILIPFVLASIFMKQAITAAKEMCYLIVTCALVMMLGAVFMLTGLWLESLKFAAILTAFMFLVLTPFLMFNGKKLRDLAKASNAITKIIIVCAAVLIIGAIFIMLGWAVPAIEFGAILGAFIWLVVTPFGLFGKKLQKAGPALWALMAIIIASAAVLIIGAEYIRKFGSENAIIFGILLASFVGIIGGIAVILGKFKKDLLIGSAAMTIIVAISFLFALTLEKIAEAMSIADPTDVLIGVGIIVLIMLAIGGLAVAAGILAMPPQGIFFWAGLGALAAISGIALMFSVAMKNIAIAAKLIAEATKEGFTTDGAMAIIEGMISIGEAVGAAGASLPMGTILLTSIACMAMAKMIDKIGLAVARVSNLTVGTAWDSEGNAISFRQLDKKDFDAAAENTKTIISTLGTAIIELYEQKPEIFETPSAGGIAGFFGKKDKSPFDKVVQSCTALGRMISLIAEGVANMANLTVATEWNSDGKPTSFRTLKQEDFDLAASGTKTIISTLGNAICELYNEQKHLFEVPDVTVKVGFIKIKKSGSGPTIFEKVVTACTSMGQMISSIGKGVGDMADLKVADQWDKEGNPIHYRYLTSKDFAMAALNTSLIVRALGSALAKTYEENQEMFKTTFTFVDGKLQGDTPIIRVINAGQQMGQMVSSIAGGIQDIANLRMPTKWDKNGNATEWREMTPEDFVEAGVKVGLITTVLASALGDVYKKHPELFDPVTTMVKTKDGWFSDTYEAHTEDAPMVKVLKAAGGLGQFISENAEAVMKVADLKFEDKNGKKINIKISDLSKGGKVSKNIVAITTCLGLTLSDVYFTGNYRDTMFNPEWVVYKQLPESIKLGTSIVEQCLSLLKTVEEKLGSAKKDNVLNNWSKTLKSIFEPFADETKINDKSIKHIKEIGESNFAGIDQLVTNVNKIDTVKADKFIELASELSNLSSQFSDMSQFVDALNGKINETLAHLSDKLGDAASTIKQSDKAQAKRQKLIEKNTKNLEKILDKPMKLEISKAKSSTIGGGSSGGGGSKSSGTPASSQQNQQTGGGGSNADITRLVTAINNLVTVLQNKK